MISLKSISTATAQRAPRVVLYGVPGIGKTSFAAAAPKCVIIPTEDGLPANQEVAHFPVAKSYADVMQAVGALYTDDHDFQWLALDTLDFFEPLLWKHTAEKHGKDDIEAFGYGKGYIAAVDEARVLFQGLDALRNEKGMGIILLAHSDVKRYENPETDPYDRFTMRLQARFAAYVSDWCDCLLFANYRVRTVQSDNGFNRKRTRGIGAGERVVYTEERPAFTAKNRHGLPAEMPLDWSTFSSNINPTNQQSED